MLLEGGGFAQRWSGGSAKITINVDADSLATPKELSADSGVPVQCLLHRIRKARPSRAETVHRHLDRLEAGLARSDPLYTWAST